MHPKPESFPLLSDAVPFQSEHGAPVAAGRLLGHDAYRPARFQLRGTFVPLSCDSVLVWSLRRSVCGAHNHRMLERSTPMHCERGLVLILRAGGLQAMARTSSPARCLRARYALYSPRKRRWRSACRAASASASCRVSRSRSEASACSSDANACTASCARRAIGRHLCTAKCLCGWQSTTQHDLSSPSDEGYARTLITLCMARTSGSLDCLDAALKSSPI